MFSNLQVSPPDFHYALLTVRSHPTGLLVRVLNDSFVRIAPSLIIDQLAYRWRYLPLISLGKEGSNLKEKSDRLWELGAIEYLGQEVKIEWSEKGQPEVDWDKLSCLGQIGLNRALRILSSSTNLHSTTTIALATRELREVLIGVIQNQGKGFNGFDPYESEDEENEEREFPLEIDLSSPPVIDGNEDWILRGDTRRKVNQLIKHYVLTVRYLHHPMPKFQSTTLTKVKWILNIVEKDVINDFCQVLFALPEVAALLLREGVVENLPESIDYFSFAKLTLLRIELNTLLPMMKKEESHENFSLKSPNTLKERLIDRLVSHGLNPPERRRTLLARYLGGSFGISLLNELDLSRTLITGSAMPYCLMPDLNLKNWGGDVDFAVSCPPEELEEIAQQHFKVFSRFDPEARITRLKREQSHIYQISGPKLPRTIEIYRGFWGQISLYHLGFVRAAYTSMGSREPRFLMTVSALMSYLNRMSPNYFFHPSRKYQPLDILDKYRRRGLQVRWPKWMELRMYGYASPLYDDDDNDLADQISKLLTQEDGIGKLRGMLKC